MPFARPVVNKEARTGKPVSVLLEAEFESHSPHDGKEMRFVLAGNSGTTGETHDGNALVGRHS